MTLADHFERRPMEVVHPVRQNKRESSSDDFQRRLTGQNPLHPASDSARLPDLNAMEQFTDAVKSILKRQDVL